MKLHELTGALRMPEVIEIIDYDTKKTLYSGTVENYFYNDLFLVLSNKIVITITAKRKERIQLIVTGERR